MSDSKLTVVEKGALQGEVWREQSRLRSALVAASVNYENLGNQLMKKAEELVRLRQGALERAKAAIAEEQEMLDSNFR